MFASIKLEHCADDVAWHHRRGGMNRDFDRWLRDWRKLGSDKAFTCVEQVLPDNSRKRVRGVPDYTNANHSGSKGVYYWYTLAEGVYHITHRYKINAVRRYWLISAGGKTTEVKRNEAMEWLQQHTNAI